MVYGAGHTIGDLTTSVYCFVFTICECLQAQYVYKFKCCTMRKELDIKKKEVVYLEGGFFGFKSSYG